MTKYKLTLDAKEDLSRIYRYGIDVWNEKQADEYYFAFSRSHRSSVGMNTELG